MISYKNFLEDSTMRPSWEIEELHLRHRCRLYLGVWCRWRPAVDSPPNSAALAEAPNSLGVHQVNASDQCNFVRNASDCRSLIGYVDYVNFMFCTFETTPPSVVLGIPPSRNKKDRPTAKSKYETFLSIVHECPSPIEVVRTQTLKEFLEKIPERTDNDVGKTRRREVTNFPQKVASIHIPHDRMTTLNHRLVDLAQILTALMYSGAEVLRHLR
ncbi:SLC8B1 [Cordylochernes scorpioides]|uniref:SLC8B1 n=1 Tax=Cordylochernes scorpioides TaxID=51811 RepID=A0ABY6KW22_9ARAC|nr:SLC8B1 [Cordylochernes scorpioides]